MIDSAPTDDPDLDGVLAKLAGKDGLTPTERTVVLVALLDAAGILTKVIVVEDKKALKARAKQLSEGDWAAKAVKDAVAEMTTIAGVT